MRQSEATHIVQLEFGDHDWQPNPAGIGNRQCARCGLFTGADCGDGCPDNPVRRRDVWFGAWTAVAEQ